MRRSGPPGHSLGGNAAPLTRNIVMPAMHFSEVLACGAPYHANVTRVVGAEAYFMCCKEC